MSDIDETAVESDQHVTVVDVTGIPFDELFSNDESALANAVRRVLGQLETVHDVTAGWSSRLR